MDRRFALFAALVVGLAILVIAAILARPEPPVEEPVAVPPPAAPAPEAPNQPPPKRMERIALPAPAHAEPPRVPKNQVAANLAPAQWQKFNVAVDASLRAAREDCFSPWLADNPVDAGVEIVFDAVLVDGRIAEIGLRTFVEVPQTVLDCVSDRAWDTEWPETSETGVLRLQRALTITH